MIGVLLMWMATALAQSPSHCEELTEVTGATTSVAWVSPAGKRVWGHQYIPVVPAAQLRRWIQHESADMGRLLQGLGLRKRGKAPRRNWKVTVFEVDPRSLCRPVSTDDTTTAVAGHAVCPKGERGVRGLYAGCGYTWDFAEGGKGLDTYRVKWRDAATQGFCTLPADRYLRGK